jgi:hypothetical protein
MRLVILTGASGSGKTAIAETIRLTRPDLAEVLHFDSIGVPSPEERRAWGPDGAWQRAMTLARGWRGLRPCLAGSVQCCSRGKCGSSSSARARLWRALAKLA